MAIIIILNYILWLFCPFIDGLTEGFLWTLNAPNPIPRKWNHGIHKAFLAQRFVWWLCSCAIIFFASNDWLITGLYGLSIGLVFPFFHLGVMYETRNMLDGSYKDGFFSDPSDTSEAKINISYRIRLIWALTSMLIFAALIATTWNYETHY
jgi:hypothetical protein